MKRYFVPSEMLAMVRRMSPEAAEEQEQGIGARDAKSLLPPIITGILAFDGPPVDAGYTFFAHGAIDFVCVLQKYFIGREAAFYPPARVKSDLMVAQNEQTLSALATVLEVGLQRFRNARAWLEPDFHQYYVAKRAPVLDGEVGDS